MIKAKRFFASAVLVGLASVIGLVSHANSHVHSDLTIAYAADSNDTRTFTFTDKESITSQGWVSNPSNLTWNKDNSNRGISLSKSEGALEYALTDSYSVTTVTITASANATGYTLYVSNGEETYGSQAVTKSNNSIYTFDNCDFQSGDTVTVSWTKTSSVKSIMFKEIEFTTIEESTAELENISITTPPTKTTYYEGEALDISGMVVTANFSDSTNRILADNEFTINPAAGSILSSDDSSFTITFNYQGIDYTTEQAITVTPRTLQSLSVTKQPDKTEYVIGQSFNPTGMIVIGTYDIGESVDLTSVCTYSPTQFLSSGSQVVTISYPGTEISTSITVNVIEKKVTSLSLTNKIDSFDAGDYFVFGDDAKLVAKYNDGEEIDLTIASEGVEIRLFTSLEQRPEEGTLISSSHQLTKEDDGKYVGVSYLGANAQKYRISVREIIDISDGKFIKVNDASEIEVGDNIVITGEKDGTLYALSTTQNDNNRSTVSVVANDDESLSLKTSGDVQIIEVGEGITTNTFSLGVTGGYLYAASTTNKNYLRTEDTLDDEGRGDWTIIINNGEATIAASTTATTRKILKFNENSTGDPLFSCYQDGQNNPSIYKFYSNDYLAVSNFVETYMHMSDYSGEGSGLCLGADGYYFTAKEALTKLTQEQIELFKTDADFEEAHQRYLAWATANKDATPYETEFTYNALGSQIFSSNDDLFMVVPLISIIALAIVVFLFVRKKKANNK